MRISDGGLDEVIESDAKQLHDGAVAYSPTSTDITVRLEIKGVDGTSSLSQCDPSNSLSPAFKLPPRDEELMIQNDLERP